MTGHTPAHSPPADAQRQRATDVRALVGRLWPRLPLLLAGAALAGCSSVTFARSAVDFDTAYRTTLYRLHIVAAPAPAGDAALGAMVAKMAQRAINHHRDYIVRQASTANQLDASACSEKIEGVLHLEPFVCRSEDGAKVRLTARLLRCQDGAIVFEGAVHDAWASEDDNLVQVRAQYVREHGKAVEPMVAPLFHAVRELVDALPRPKLEKDADIDEKIELGQ